MSFSVAGKRVVVTGGSRGIGAALARGLVEAGAKMAGVGRDRERRAAAARIGGPGGKGAFFCARAAVALMTVVVEPAEAMNWDRRAHSLLPSGFLASV